MIPSVVHFLLLSAHLVCAHPQQQQVFESPASPNVSSPLNARFSAKVNETLNYFHVPGLSVAVIHGSEIYAEGYGHSTLPNTRATAETLYYGGSTTKAFTAAALSLLIDDSSSTSLTWRTKISSLLPSFILSDDYATTHTTLEDILSHRTGLPRHDFTLARKNTSIPALISSLRYLPFTAEPRTRFQYNNLMFITAGHIIETLTSTSLAQFLKTRIWDPLNMTSTFLDREEALDSGIDFANGYFWNRTRGAYTLIPRPPTENVGGAGAVISSVCDYALWVRSLLLRAPPLSENGHREIVRARTVLEPESLGLVREVVDADVVYALGWWKYSYRGQAVVAHGGSIDGFGAFVLWLPKRQWGVVLLGNTQGSSNWVQNVLAYWLLDELLDVPEEERFDWVALYEKQVARLDYLNHHAKEILYPNLPAPPLPHALSVAAYTGLYTNEAFPRINLTAENNNTILRAVNHASDMTNVQVDLEHVSGEHWFANVTSLITGETVGLSRAQFRVGVGGEVEGFGFELDGELAALGRQTWWRKVG